MNLLNLLLSVATATEMASGSFFKAVSRSRIGLYCGEMGSQPKLKVDLPVTVQNCFYNSVNTCSSLSSQNVAFASSVDPKRAVHLFTIKVNKNPLKGSNKF